MRQIAQAFGVGMGTLEGTCGVLMNNIGLLRNAETLEWLDFAPIFDSGSSLDYDKLVSQIKVSSGIECKPFKKHHDKQLKLVTDFG